MSYRRLIVLVTDADLEGAELKGALVDIEGWLADAHLEAPTLEDLEAWLDRLMADPAFLADWEQLGELLPEVRELHELIREDRRLEDKLRAMGWTKLEEQ